MTSSNTAAQDRRHENEQASKEQHSDPSHLHSWRLAVVFTSLCLGAVLYGLDMNIIGVAAPAITSEFHSLGDIAWYSTAHQLTITAFQMFFGNMYRYFPAKTVYLGSIAVFEIGSVLCATATRSAMLILGRAVLGFGAAGLLQGALGIVAFIVKLEKVPMYQGMVAAAAAVSATAGPVIGGGLTDHMNWRWCFWINVPIGVVVMGCVFLFCNISYQSNRENYYLPLSEKLKHLDFAGTALFLGSIVSLLLVLQWGGRTITWSSPTSIGLFVCFGTLMILFLALQWMLGEYATIPFRIVRIRSVYMGALVLFTLGIASISLAYYLPLYFQAVKGLSATRSGVNMLAYVAPTIVSIGITGSLVTRYGYYVPYMIAGITIAAIAAGFLTQLDASTSTLKWAAWIVVHRIGLGMAQQLPYTAMQAVLETADTMMGNAIAIFFWTLGGAVAVSVGQNLLLHDLRVNIPTHTTTISVQSVIDSGAGGLRSIAPNALVLQQLREAYAVSLKGTFRLALFGTCLALPFAAGMQWLNIKRIAEERRARVNREEVGSGLRCKSDVELATRWDNEPTSPR